MADEYDGVGGSYLVDPKTGKRTLVERTDSIKPEKTEKQPIVQPQSDIRD